MTDYILKCMDFIKEKQLDISELKDIMTAIVITDSVVGGRQRYSYDKLVSKDEVIWWNLINYLGINSENTKYDISFAKVQKYRLLCDTLTIYLTKHNIDCKNSSLCTLSARIVADTLQLNLEHANTLEDINIVETKLGSILYSDVTDIVEFIQMCYKKNSVATNYIVTKHLEDSFDVDYNLNTNTEFYHKLGKKMRRLPKDKEIFDKIRKELSVYEC